MTPLKISSTLLMAGSPPSGTNRPNTQPIAFAGSAKDSNLRDRLPLLFLPTMSELSCVGLRRRVHQLCSGNSLRFSKTSSSAALGLQQSVLTQVLTIRIPGRLRGVE